MLPVIGLFLSCLASVYFLFAGVIPLLRSWSVLTSPDSASYHPLFGPYIGFTIFMDVAILVVSIFLLVLVFKRKRILPKIIIHVYAFFLFMTLVDFVAVVTFIDQFMAQRGFADEASTLVTQGIAGVVVRGLIVCGIWIPYFLYSKRVRDTFVEPWNSSRRVLPESGARATISAAPAAEAAVGAAVADETVAPAETETRHEAADRREVPTVSVPPAWAATPAHGPVSQSRFLLIPLVGIMVIILVVVISLGVWRSANPPQVANPVTITHDTAGNKLKHYSNIANGFSFDYPADWVMNAGQPVSASATFQVSVLDPAGKKIDNESVDGLVLVVFDASGGSTLSVSELRRTVETNVSSATAGQGWQIVVAVKDVTVNDMPGVTFTCRIPSPSGEKIVAPMYYLIGNGHLFYVSMMSSEDPSDQTKPKLDAILQSLHGQP